MKKIYSLIAVLLISVSVFGQAPSSFKYQAVLRDARGNIRANTSTSIIISILSGSATGTRIYTETHSVKTDGYGLVNLEIGKGTASVGTMAAIDWSTGTFFIETSVDGIIMGTNQLLSVPFAQYANRAANGISHTDSAKLAGIATGAEVNVNADWNATNGDAQILNKPTSDGSETKVTGSANVTVTGTGTIATPYIISTSSNPVVHTIGDSYGGGIIFYVYDGGQHGLIAATVDATTSDGQITQTDFTWERGYSRNSTGALGNGLGAGQINTFLAVGSQENNDASGFFAAQVCSDYSVTINGVTYRGWYLPSKFELNLLYLQKAVVGGLSDKYYWSSTEASFDYTYAWFQDFTEGNGGYQYYKLKSSSYGVRPIKSF